MKKYDNEIHVKKILKLLEKEYPGAETSLNYQTPFQLLVAAILSAQTTDKQVNKITTSLFKEIRGPRDILSLGFSSLEEKLKGAGLFHQKSRQIRETSRLLCEKHGGEVPKTRDELMVLPGVGRKTANVVLSTAFSIPTLAVDTHVSRVSRRLGLTKGKTPLEIEEDLCHLIPISKWSSTHHRLIKHGRQVCRARNPFCEQCLLQSHCRYYLEESKPI